MNQAIEQALREHGYSITPQRLAVYSFMQRHDPTSMSELVDGCAHIDRASVYRTITLFRQLGIAGDAIINGRKMLELSDPYDMHHHHITCTGCGTSVSVHDELLEQDLEQLALTHGYLPTQHQIEIRGLCAQCQKEVQSSQV